MKPFVQFWDMFVVRLMVEQTRLHRILGCIAPWLHEVWSFGIRLPDFLARRSARFCKCQMLSFRTCDKKILQHEVLVPKHLSRHHHFISGEAAAGTRTRPAKNAVPRWVAVNSTSENLQRFDKFFPVGPCPPDDCRSNGPSVYCTFSLSGNFQPQK